MNRLYVDILLVIRHSCYRISEVPSIADGIPNLVKAQLGRSAATNPLFPLCFLHFFLKLTRICSALQVSKEGNKECANSLYSMVRCIRFILTGKQKRAASAFL